MITTALIGLPDLLELAARKPARYPALFESVAAHPQRARWDLLAVCDGECFELSSAGPMGFFAELSARLVTATAPRLAYELEPPFCGGWVVYLGYELAQEIEPTLRLAAPEFAFPGGLALRTPVVIAVDRVNHKAMLVGEAGSEELIAQVQADLACSPGSPAATVRRTWEITEDRPEQFLSAVARVHEYLQAGDVFQVNLSRGWRAWCAPEISPAELYANLRGSNPAPFAALLQWQGFALLSSSPERLVAVHGRTVQTRPIAGTRARGALADPELAQALIGDAKEHAEHIMLIDLERNDLGRVCVPGSIEVDELLSIESYAHVHHIVSNVRGTLRPEVGPVEVLKAVFPGGTITGCPKVRCMEIIAELEPHGRGPYTGALGYIGTNGNMDFNILIRTFAMHFGQLHFRAGAGIVADSTASRELSETRAKAKGLLEALR